ncbi:two-component system, OmpR family, response regulator TctD [Faunimonas pinastri]|uniref:Two-component system, OmpR family, response regulator TctD n=1 Tax=Faunimonas pinastri TaxID=1855383 RepID=A0A1H9CVV1_9HYPH|nr:response regulator [Faunimonas pinastri]SEQ04713.1 two-component system, OmpR family, response regulator TctD [Faunimonas pinastri]
MRLLLVEDNRELAGWLARNLRLANYVVDVVHDGEDADLALGVTEYALVILDLSLPKLDGLAVLRRLRQRGDLVPVIVLTANASLSGRIAGLDEGADDYIAKPFEMEELEARIRAQLRRANRRADPQISCGALSFDSNTRLFRLGDQPLALTPREHAVLEQLLMKMGQTVSKAALSESIFDFDNPADTSAIEIYVHRLRKKLEGSGVQIMTLRGLGYLLQNAD